MLTRGRYQGVLEIVAFKRTAYLAILGASIASVVGLPSGFQAIGWAAIAGVLYWTVASLAVSHWVYDRSDLYSLKWMTARPENWLNIHAGLDQTSELLREALPGSRFRVFDIYDSTQMTEPSIARARQLGRSEISEPVSWRSLPAESGSADGIFLIFAAHELRRPEARTLFFTEVERALSENGRAIVVEHLRDVQNFLAFGPGFLHFFSRSEWMRTFASAALRVAGEKTATQFVHVFELAKA